MKISYNWLKQYFKTEVSSEAILNALPLIGFDVEETEVLGPPQMEQVVVGEVIEFEAHPNADRLRLCKVKTTEGEGHHSIICGAKNFKAGDRVMVALPGAVLPGNFKIKKSKLRGIESEGMLCSAKELNIGQDHDGIMILDSSVALGTELNTLYSDTDIIFHLEITPNRVDALSHIGLARELVARFGGTTEIPKIHSDLQAVNVLESNTMLKSLVVEASDVCPEYSAVCIEGVQVGPSPSWLKDSLESIGLRSINNIVDITNYVLHESGQPLHAFDAAKISGQSLKIRYALDGEKVNTLDEKTHSLDDAMLVIADDSKPVAIAGVMGSADAEVDENTRSVILESAYFNPSSVRKTARKLNLSTDSSYRFERGVDPQGLKFGIERACDLIADLAGGSIVGQRVQIGSVNKVMEKIEFFPKAMRSFIGFSVEDAEVQSVFESLNFKVEVDKASDAQWLVTPPTYRQDVSRPVDLYEEFIRIYGTDKIPAQSISADGINAIDHPIYQFNDAVGAHLTGKGFNEAFLYTLRDGDEVAFFKGKDHAETLNLKLENPLQSDQSHLRNSLIPGLLDVLDLNLARQNLTSQFFERGRVFRVLEGQLVELISVGFIGLGKNLERKWLERGEFDFYSAKACMEDLFSLLPFKVKERTWSPIEASEFWQAMHSAVTGDLSKEGYQASIGLLNLKNVKERWGLSHPIFAGSLLIQTRLFENEMKRFRYQALSNQPATLKDLSLVVDKSVLASEVLKTIKGVIAQSIEGFACESVEVFDVYQGEGLEEGKKSFAVSMKFRAQDRTLKDVEVNALFEKIQSAVLKETNYQIRK